MPAFEVLRESCKTDRNTQREADQVKKPNSLPRASHVNSGTSVPPEELPWPEHDGTVLRHHKLHIEVDERPEVTGMGGLILPLALCRRFKVADKIDQHVNVLKIHVPYHESDHVLAQALMLYSGGTRLEDMAMLQQDAALLKMLGAERTPDPTTSGDFLRRFGPAQALAGLRSAIDEAQDEVWSELKRGRRWKWSRRRRKQELVVLHLDAKVKEVYGAKKQGASFSYKARWALQVLVASLDDGECVGVRLGTGSERSSERAAELLGDVLPRLVREHDDILVLADSDFDRKDVREVCEAHGACFAFVAREYENRSALADTVDDWRSFRTRAHRHQVKVRSGEGYKRRSRKTNLRRRAARKRGYDDLALQRQWVAERSWVHAGEQHADRMVFRKQLIHEETGKPGQRELWERWRYRYIITNLPESWTTEDIVDITYTRCDQENVIEQLGSGLAMWSLPVAEFHGNAAWLEIARLAWNFGKWIAKLALPEEVTRWEWKRFRRAFVHVPVQVVHHARRNVVRILGTNRFTETLVKAHALLQI